MLQNFIICVNAVIPSAIYLIIGIVLKVAHVVSDDDVKKFTHVVFVTLYPFIMFDNLYGRDIAGNMDMRLGLYATGFTAVQMIISWVFVCGIEKDNYERGAMIQALYRSNYVLMGFPIAINLFGKGNITAVAIIMMLVVPFYNISAVIVFETFRGGKIDPGHIFKRILTNPIIDGGIAAFIVMLLGIDLPAPVINTIGTLSDATAPIAMILLGAALNLNGFSSDRWRIAVCTIGKLIVFPAAGIAGAVYTGGTVSNCVNKAPVSTNRMQVSRIGGIVGTLNSKGIIEGNTNEGKVTIKQAAANNNWQSAGGICGFQEKESSGNIIRKNTNKGEVVVEVENATTHANKVAAGGIIGLGVLGLEISDNVNSGEVSIVNKAAGPVYAGGIVGWFKGAGSFTQGNENKAAVSAKTSDDAEPKAGGVVAYSSDSTNTCTSDKNTGAVTCANAGSAGSLAGTNAGSLVNCAAGGSVNGTALTDANFATYIQGASSAGSATGTTFAK